MKGHHISRYINPIFQTPCDACYWFGYYNYDPLHSDASKLLCNRAEFDAVPIEKGMSMEVGYFDIRTRQWHPIGVTDSFNWQQGAMLQWIPSEKPESQVIYNCSREGHLISRIHDINTGKTRELDYPIYGLTPDGKKSIALNMERAYWCRGYHYQSVANPQYDVNIAEDDGIYEIDLQANTCHRIIAIDQVINMDYDPSFYQAKHWLEHIMIDPTGSRFCFLHRFSYGNIYQYETRLFIADIDGSNLQVIDGWRQYRWSHFGWGPHGNFTIYAYKKANTELNAPSSVNNQDKASPHPMGLKKRLKEIYHHLAPLPIQLYIQQNRSKGTQFYQYYEEEEGRFVKKAEWGHQHFYIDGHPSFTADNHYMITDSYPDWKGMQHLVAYDMTSRKSVVLGTFKDALTRKPGSCDLHPKLSRTNKHLTIDTAYDGKHHVMSFEIDWDKIKEATSSGTRHDR